MFRWRNIADQVLEEVVVIDDRLSDWSSHMERKMCLSYPVRFAVGVGLSSAGVVEGVRLADYLPAGLMEVSSITFGFIFATALARLHHDLSLSYATKVGDALRFPLMVAGAVGAAAYAVDHSIISWHVMTSSLLLGSSLYVKSGNE